MTSAMMRFYTEEYAEAGRLHRSAIGRLELMRTQELLARHLPPPGAMVADVGGGPGAYAGWLAHEGYRVRLLDLVPTHVEHVRASFPSVAAEVGDARSLPWPDAAVDATLLLGPLYHLATQPDRLLAVQEAVRVTRSGGVVVAAAISRNSPLLDLAVQGRLTGVAVDRAGEVRRSGRHDPRLGFTDAYLHSSVELATELDEAGLRDVVVYGVEGPLWPATRLLPPDADLRQYATVAGVLEVDPAAVELSGHLLGVGTVV